jgi:hypothetical protein
MDIILPDIDSNKCKICENDAAVTLFNRLHLCVDHFSTVKTRLNAFDLAEVEALREKRIKIQNFLNKSKDELALLLYNATEELESLREV